MIWYGWRIDVSSEPVKSGQMRPNPATAASTLRTEPAKSGQIRTAEKSLFHENRPNSITGACLSPKSGQIRPTPATERWRAGARREAESLLARTIPDISGHAICRVYPVADNLEYEIQLRGESRE